MSFRVAVDTRESPRVNVSQTVSKDADKMPKPTPTPEPVIPFSDIPEDKRGPKVQTRQHAEPQDVIEVPFLNVSLLPAVVRSELQKLEEKLLIGDITIKGYNLTKAELLKPYEALAQVADSLPGNEINVHRKAYKDLEGEQLEGEQPVMSKKEKPVTPFIPVHIDDKQFVTPKQHQVNAAIERPMTSKLLGSISKIKSAEGQAEDTAGGAPVGRKLQHFISADRGFLPWERRKYFQELLEVSRV